MEVRFNTRELDWLNDYAGNHGMSVEAAVRAAVRMFSLVVNTPGAREAVQSIASAGLPQKWEPPPPIVGSEPQSHAEATYWILHCIDIARSGGNESAADEAHKQLTALVMR